MKESLQFVCIMCCLVHNVLITVMSWVSCIVLSCPVLSCPVLEDCRPLLHIQALNLLSFRCAIINPQIYHISYLLVSGCTYIRTHTFVFLVVRSMGYIKCMHGVLVTLQEALLFAIHPDIGSGTNV